MQTNANSSLIAALLADARVGTFTGIITRKVGETKGGVLYGDDLVHVVIFTGFRYDRLVQRSLDLLPSITDDAVVAQAAAKGVTLTLADVATARAELEASFKASLDGTNEATTDEVYEPLTVDGQSVRGGRVYRCKRETGAEGKCHCRKCSGDAKAPLDRTIYVQGLRIWSEVLEAAKNGPVPAPKSAPKTVAKNLLRAALPVSKYVSYRLEPGTDFMLRAGGTAAVEATTRGFTVTDDIMKVIERAA